MIKAVLFDLDGTLLSMDQDEFMKAYFGSLAKRLSTIGYDPKLLIPSIRAGSSAMIKNDGSRTNENAFWDMFNLCYGKNARADEPYFYSYYVEDFDKVSAVCKSKNASPVIEKIKSLGLRIALATNPLFPSIATEKRILWAGLNKEDFEIVTTYENSRYCKPNLKYYQDILCEMNISADEAIMVGNDVDDDMVAKELGMKVFLVTDCLINKSGKGLFEYPSGTLDDFMEYLTSLV